MINEPEDLGITNIYNKTQGQRGLKEQENKIMNEKISKGLIYTQVWSMKGQD